MKINKLLVVFNLIILIGFAFYTGQSIFHSKKISCYDEKKVFEKFNCKIDLEKKLKNVQEARLHILDSLSAIIKVVNSNYLNLSEGEKTNYTNVKSNYIQLKDQFEEDNQKTILNYNTQIYKQMDQYINDYCISKHINYMFSYNTSHSTTYVNEGDDRTEDLILFMNTEYAGKK